jgi:hypothetical protein
MSVHNILKFIQLNINFSKRDFLLNSNRIYLLSVRQLMILLLAHGKSTSFQSYQLQVKNIDLVD